MAPAPHRKTFPPPRDAGPRRPRFARPAVERLEARCLLTGLYGLTVRLGATLGTNVFRIQAGNVSTDIAITGR